MVERKGTLIGAANLAIFAQALTRSGVASPIPERFSRLFFVFWEKNGKKYPIARGTVSGILFFREKKKNNRPKKNISPCGHRPDQADPSPPARNLSEKSLLLEPQSDLEPFLCAYSHSLRHS
jgi:hypothetical protein